MKSQCLWKMHVKWSRLPPHLHQHNSTAQGGCWGHITSYLQRAAVTTLGMGPGEGPSSLF